MPKVYYRCSKCHSKIKYYLENNIRAVCICPKCGRIKESYACQHDYWWERLYLTVRNYIRIFINILKIIRDIWREFLVRVKDYNELERILKKWSKK